MDFKLTRDMIESMFRMSEGTISPITGNAAHAAERHSGITNVNLQKRQGRHNQIELFTAFQDFAQAVDVAEIIFNQPSVTPRLERLYYKGKQGKGSRSDDSGQEVITHDIVKPVTARYQNAGHVADIAFYARPPQVRRAAVQLHDLYLFSDAAGMKERDRRCTCVSCSAR